MAACARMRLINSLPACACLLLAVPQGEEGDEDGGGQGSSGQPAYRR